MAITTDKKYFAFISYKCEDEEWAKWLQHEIENYHLPATLHHRYDLPNNFRPVFRDIDELKAGNLPEQIYTALVASKNLIVICSPRSAKSEWVNKEINDFITIGKRQGIDNFERIFPFIVEGYPHAKSADEECYPIALKSFPSNKERLGGNVNESGRDKAFVKVLAGMLPNVSFDILWNRYERDKAEEERLKNEERERFLKIQSRYVAEKALMIAEDDSYLARMLAISILPKNVSNPDRPYTAEAENLLRLVVKHNNAVLYGHTSYINSVLFSPNGKYLVSASDDETMIIWDVNTGRPLRVITEFISVINYACFSNDSKYIVSSEKYPYISIWETETGEEIQRIKEEGMFLFACFSYDNKYIISVLYSDLLINVWDIRTGMIIRKFPIIGYPIIHTSNNNGIIRVFTLLNDGTINIYNTNNGQIEGVLHKHDALLSAAYSPDDKLIITTSYDSIKIWNNKTKNLVKIIDDCGAHYISFSPSGILFATASSDNKVRIWYTESFTILKTIEGHDMSVGFVSFSPDGKQIVLSSYEKIRVIDLGNIVEYRTFAGHNDIVWSVSYSNDGRYLVSASDDKTVKIWDAITGDVIKVFDGFFYGVKWATFSYDNLCLVANSFEETFVWNLKENDCLLYNDDCYRKSSFSHDGSRIVSYCEKKSSVDNKVICITDIKSEAIIKVLNVHVYPIKAIMHSNDGKYVLTVSADMLNIWDAESYVKVDCFNGYDSAIGTQGVALGVAAISPDNKTIACVLENNSIIVWDVKTHAVIARMEGNTSFITSINYSPCGSKIVSASEDKTVKIWDVQTGFMIKNIEEDAIVMCAAFSPNGRHIAVSTSNGKIHIYDFMPLQELIDQTRKRFEDRPLTPAERRQYYLE